MNALVERLIKWGDDIADKFEDASSKGRKNPDQIAGFREGKTREFLTSFFPFPYRVVKGVICDSQGQDSASVDAVLLHPTHPFTQFRDGELLPEIILADGVVCAIEVKSDPTNKGEIKNFIRQSKQTKNLRRPRAKRLWLKNTGKVPEKNLRDLIDEISCEVPYFVFL